MADKPKPHKIRGAGGVTASVWKNDGPNGPFYTVTPGRNYKDADGNWKETDLKESGVKARDYLRTYNAHQ